jgi:hypothetical protein
MKTGASCHSTVRLPRLGRGRWLAFSAGLCAALGAHASDNAKSFIKRIPLIKAYEAEHPIPKIVVRHKPPSLQLLKQELATQEQMLANEQAGLAQAQAQLAFWQTQPEEVAAINVPLAQNAVTSAENTLAAVERQVAYLLQQTGGS